MLATPLPVDEETRVEALNGLGLLDTPPEPRFDRITRLAGVIARAPIALICLVDRQRLWVKSQQGLELAETARDNSFCAHAILAREPLIVTDTRQDPRFADNPLVTGLPFARFYAGHPIHAPGGARVGTLCVMDTRPRLLSPGELGALADLAALVDGELLAARYRLATRTVGVGVHERHEGDRTMWWSEAMWDIFGRERDSFPATVDNWLTVIHPEDRERVLAGGATTAAGAPRSLQYRIIRPDGSVRHLQTLAARSGPRGDHPERIAGITLDVTARVAAEQQAHGQQQLLRERSHQAGMAEIAGNVLHGVGNAVNSLGIANATIRRELRAVRVEQLQQATALLRVHRTDLPFFLTQDERGRHLPDYLAALSDELAANVLAAHTELDTCDELLGQLKDFVCAQQLRAQAGGEHEPVDLEELLEATLAGFGDAGPGADIEVVRHYEPLPPVTSDRHKLLLILENVLDNARDAVLSGGVSPGRIVVRLARDGGDALISIEDSGVGMSADVLARIWGFGFTTKAPGQGFNLHHAANAAREIGATLTAHSDGPQQGARFTVRVPQRPQRAPR